MHGGSSLRGLLNIELVLCCDRDDCCRIVWQAQAMSFDSRRAGARTDDADTAAMIKTLSFDYPPGSKANVGYAPAITLPVGGAHKGGKEDKVLQA